MLGTVMSNDANFQVHGATKIRAMLSSDDGQPGGTLLTLVATVLIGTLARAEANCWAIARAPTFLIDRRNSGISQKARAPEGM